MSSKFLQKPLYEGKALENQLINSAINAHDLCCGCLQPYNHLAYLFCSTSSKKCPISTTGEDRTEEDTIQEGDLEKLFEEDVFGEG